MAARRQTDCLTGTVTTTDATQTTALSFTIPADGVVCQVEMHASARKTSNNDGAIFGEVAAAVREGGAAAIIGAVANLFTAVADAGLTTASVTMDANSTEVRVRVTGVAATTIDWFVTVKVYMS